MLSCVALCMCEMNAAASIFQLDVNYVLLWYPEVQYVVVHCVALHCGVVLR